MDIKTENYMYLEKSFKRGLVSRFLLELAHRFSDFQNPSHETYVIDQITWRNLIGSLHYLGGSPESVDSDGFPSDENIRKFIISPSNGQGFYDPSKYTDVFKDITIPDAKLADFIPNTIRCLFDYKRSQKEVILIALKELREYLIQNQPNVSIILQHIGEGNIDSNNFNKNKYSLPTPLYNDKKVQNISNFAAVIVGRFLAGESAVLIDSLADVGIITNIFPDVGNKLHHDFHDEKINYAENALINMYFPFDDYKEH